MTVIGITPEGAKQRKIFFDADFLKSLDAQIFDPNVFATYDPKIKEIKDKKEQEEFIKTRIYEKIATILSRFHYDLFPYYIDRIALSNDGSLSLVYMDLDHDIFITSLDLKTELELSPPDQDEVTGNVKIGFINEALNIIPTEFLRTNKENKNYFENLALYEKNKPATILLSPQQPILDSIDTTYNLKNLSKTFKNLQTFNEAIDATKKNNFIFKQNQNKRDELLKDVEQEPKLKSFVDEKMKLLDSNFDFLDGRLEKNKALTDQLAEKIQNDFSQQYADYLTAANQSKYIKESLGWLLYQVVGSQFIKFRNDKEALAEFNNLVNNVIDLSERNTPPTTEEVYQAINSKTINEIENIFNRLMNSNYSSYQINNSEKNFLTEVNNLALKLQQNLHIEVLPFQAWETTVPVLGYKLRGGFECENAAKNSEKKMEDIATFVKNQINDEEEYKNFNSTPIMNDAIRVRFLRDNLKKLETQKNNQRALFKLQDQAAKVKEEIVNKEKSIHELLKQLSERQQEIEQSDSRDNYGYRLCFLEDQITQANKFQKYVQSTTSNIDDITKQAYQLENEIQALKALNDSVPGAQLYANTILITELEKYSSALTEHQKELENALGEQEIALSTIANNKKRRLVSEFKDYLWAKRDEVTDKLNISNLNTESSLSDVLVESGKCKSFINNLYQKYFFSLKDDAELYNQIEKDRQLLDENYGKLVKKIAPLKSEPVKQEETVLPENPLLQFENMPEDAVSTSQEPDDDTIEDASIYENIKDFLNRRGKGLLWGTLVGFGIVGLLGANVFSFGLPAGIGTGIACAGAISTLLGSTAIGGFLSSFFSSKTNDHPVYVVPTEDTVKNDNNINPQPEPIKGFNNADMLRALNDNKITHTNNQIQQPSPQKDETSAGVKPNQPKTKKPSRIVEIEDPKDDRKVSSLSLS